ncbi:MAG: endolytic transglycosylase MltG [candidate division WOR-3 bacterium]
MRVLVLLSLIFLSCAQRGEKVYVILKRGESLDVFLNKLKGEGVIKNPTILKILLRFSGIDKALKPGRYVFYKNQNEISAFISIKKGPEMSYVKFTIKEGDAIRDMVKSVKDLDLDPVKIMRLSRDTIFISYLSQRYNFPFLKGKRSLEGFLYPDTYFLDYGITEEEFFLPPLRRFKEVWDSLDVENKAENVGLTPYGVLILASIVEKEAVLEYEKPLIASVFLNRLKRGMPLAADPTIKYILENPPKILSYKHTTIESPYNTYKYPGLPPTPVCSPSASTIYYVLNPTKTDYLYFSSKDGTEHYFAKTYKEHLRNVKRMELR